MYNNPRITNRLLQDVIELSQANKENLISDSTFCDRAEAIMELCVTRAEEDYRVLRRGWRFGQAYRAWKSLKKIRAKAEIIKETIAKYQVRCLLNEVNNDGYTPITVEV